MVKKKKRGGSLTFWIWNDICERSEIEEKGGLNVNLAVSPLSNYYFSLFLVACTRLYKSLCRSVGRSVGPSVGRSVTLYFFCVFEQFEGGKVQISTCFEFLSIFSWLYKSRFRSVGPSVHPSVHQALPFFFLRFWALWRWESTNFDLPWIFKHILRVFFIFYVIFGRDCMKTFF